MRREHEAGLRRVREKINTVKRNVALCLDNVQADLGKYGGRVLENTMLIVVDGKQRMLSLQPSKQQAGLERRRLSGHNKEPTQWQHTQRRERLLDLTALALPEVDRERIANECAAAQTLGLSGCHLRCD